MMAEEPAAAPVDAPEEMGPVEKNFLEDKSFLMSTTNSAGVNLYDHLVTCLRKILEERPLNVVDVFEDLSRECKKPRTADGDGGVAPRVDRSTEIALAEIQKKLFAAPDGDEDEAVGEEEADPRLPNLLQLAHFFEQGSVGIDREEICRLWLSLKQLVEERPIERLRFWGKIFGTEQNYYVTEVEFREGEGEEEAEEEAEPERDEREDEEGEEEEIEDDTPKPNFKKPPPVPKEEAGTGANKYAYFVCNEPGKAWIRLPSVTPEQIAVARQIRKFFTGRLDSQVVSWPPFNGNEAAYLRAQIARISAGTIVSPKDFYNFGDEEEEDDEGMGRDSCIENPEYEPHPVRELLDSNNWVHHVQHILPQGRTVWWDPAQLDEEEENEEEDEEESRADVPKHQREEGPQLLSPLSEDAAVDGLQPWTIRMSTGLLQQFGIVTVSSNLWPGAHSVAAGKVCENIYIGWGQKYLADNFTASPPPPVMSEFRLSPEQQDLVEDVDPTPEEEAAQKAMLEEAEEGDEEGLGEEDEEDDDA